MIAGPQHRDRQLAHRRAHELLGLVLRALVAVVELLAGVEVLLVDRAAAVARDHRGRPVDDALEPRRIAREVEHRARAADVDPPRGLVVDAHEVDAGEVMDPGQLFRQRAVLGARQPEVHVADVADEDLGAIAGAERLEQLRRPRAANLSRASTKSFVSGSAARSFAIIRFAVNAGKPVTSATLVARERDAGPSRACARAAVRGSGRTAPRSSATTRSTSRASAVEVAVFSITQVAAASLSASGSLRGDPRARVVGVRPIARDQPRCWTSGGAATTTGRRAPRGRGSRRAAPPRRTRRWRRHRPTSRSRLRSRRRSADA